MAGSGRPGVHTPAGRDRHADHEATRPGTPPGTATGHPSPARAPLAHGAWPQACQALLRRHRPALTVEGGHPRSNDGTQLCPAQRPRAPHALAAEGGSGRNAIIIRLLKKKGFQKEAGRTNRVVRPGCIHAPGIHQEPCRGGAGGDEGAQGEVTGGTAVDRQCGPPAGRAALVGGRRATTTATGGRGQTNGRWGGEVNGRP